MLTDMVQSEDADRSLRSHALSELCDMGEVAIPHLFRLSFDEVVTDHQIEGDPIRVCHRAVNALAELLGRDLGFEGDGFVEIPSDEDVERVRAEARKRGYAPE